MYESIDWPRKRSPRRRNRKFFFLVAIIAAILLSEADRGVLLG